MQLLNKKNTAPVEKGVARVPVIMQMEALECGAACLAMICAYYGKWIPLEQVRTDCGVSRDGSNLKNVILAARDYGFLADGYRVETETLQEKASFPCIIHWNFNHFVVLCGFRKGKAVLNDPARGTVNVSMEEFDNAFTGICLLLSPGESFVPGGRRKSTVAFASRRLQGAGAAVAFVVLTSIITSLFGVINPILSRVFFDRLLSGRNPGWLRGFISVMVLLGILQVAVAWVQTVYSLRINGKMSVVGNTSYMWKVLRLPMEFFSQRMAGDILQRQGTNASIAGTLVETVAPLALNSVMMIFYLILMIRYSPILTMVGFASSLLNVLTARMISEKRVNLMRVQMRDEGKLAATTMAGISMTETIKASGAENGFFRKWAGYQAAVNTEQVKFTEMNTRFGILPSFITAASNYAVLFLGIGFAMRSSFTLGMITVFQGFLNSFMEPANILIGAGQTIQEMRTDMERIEDVMEYSDDPCLVEKETGEDTDYSKLSGNVELRDVTFGYSRLAEPVVKGFSMSLKTGSRVAIVGASGCGKSTISKLIAGLYQPWSGEILFDGRNRTEIPRSVFTGSLAVVDQDIILFEDTIANNIRMWDDTIEDFEVILAARDAQIHDDILQRPGGYRGKLSENGKDLSGGQRQRLEIARVLAQDPSIIILDEATSALDARTEYDVVKAIQDRGITCIVVAHRLSTIRDCDEIIVLDKGVVVERGTHEELYARGGVYTELITSE
ncbi:MAG: NHLP family bacteriocin export ABC transporter peptidase/permease/ATPase subunit [Eubacteriales bacterium]|nr:NHLP family bacteriocin export ABC transporter peptidase/permease/ATPase subunit [Eubacteriales bacterium]